jgi:predicted CXXCH cytochrome family protein
MKNSPYLIILLYFAIHGLLFGQSIINTVHNLSVSGTGSITATSESKVCVFCHIPHNSSPRTPLWNKPDPGFNYTEYSSSTIQATIGQPTGSSILCLSCHDGTIALGEILSQPAQIVMNSGITTMPIGSAANLSQDLSNDHPVSFIYNSTLSSNDGELVDPATLSGPVILENTRLECISCHDAHSDLFGDFLVASNQYSELCLYCHQKSFWSSSQHNASTATWNNTGTNPWLHTPFTSVTENACENCHNPHNAEGNVRLMNYLTEETNCYTCHNGNVASQNIETIVATRTYVHDISSYAGQHDPNENAIVQTRHVECQDCHNPHASTATVATAPFASGTIIGTKGVDTNGNPVTSIQYEYELCYRCHADSPDKPSSPTSRQIVQDNTRLEFELNNPSFHPIEGAGINSNVPSLIAPLNESSIIYCTDCHATDGAGAPKGPHGSIYPHILKFNYVTADHTTESYFAYELCYQCHDRTTITNSSSSFGRRVHRRHIMNTDAPCNTCHDPHGINNAQVSTSDHSHLINFDISIVQPNGNGELRFVDNGDFAGQCYLECHNHNHNGSGYAN